MTLAAYTADLRRELAQRAWAYAELHGIPCYLSLGGAPTVLFERSEDGMGHGNFLDASFKRIVLEPGWARRLRKPHTSPRSLPIERRDGAVELDSSASSDALLMNVLCYPGLLDGPRIRGLLGLGSRDALVFGHRAHVPYRSGADNTELDLLAGDLIVEAKLTEQGFGAKPLRMLQRYRDFEELFAPDALARDHLGRVEGYQLVRNVLAAHHLGARFRLLYDERRPDLCDHLYRVLRAVRDGDLRARCGAVTWQEVARQAPEPLRAFLDEKYGIR